MSNIFIFLSFLVIVNWPAGRSVGLRKLPEKLIVGYASWGECDTKLVEAVKQGVNVLIWFSINLVVDEYGQPLISGGPDLECVINIKNEIAELKLPTTHLISIGGWNSPHPDTSNSPQLVFQAWKDWNNEIFDGFDWDIEGNDDPLSPYNHFTIDCLNLIGQMSQLAKSDGYVVSMAPAESYVDPTTSLFDLDLNHSYPEWQPIVPDFKYHGRNVYSYLLLKFGTTEDIHCNMSAQNRCIPAENVPFKLDTFDFVTVQLYEGYSHAEYNTTILKQSAANHIATFARSMFAGWELQIPCIFMKSLGYITDSDSNKEGIFSDLSDCVSAARLSVSPTRLVVGLSNGWAGDGKFFLAYPDQVAVAYADLTADGIGPRGFAFWDIADEGKISPQRPAEPLWMAAGLNAFMQIRT